MIRIYSDLFVGDQGDYEYQVKGQDGWAVVHACKEPYHRQLLGLHNLRHPEKSPGGPGTHTDVGAHVGVPLPTYRRPTNHE